MENFAEGAGSRRKLESLTGPRSTEITFFVEGDEVDGQIGADWMFAHDATNRFDAGLERMHPGAHEFHDHEGATEATQSRVSLIVTGLKVEIPYSIIK